MAFVSNLRRDAWGTIAGFVLQVNLTIKRWLSLADDEALELERGEDIDTVQQQVSTGQINQDRILEQVKRRSGTLTLRSRSAVEALANFCHHRTTNPERKLRFRFVTTAVAGTEQGWSAGESGISTWEVIRQGEFLDPDRKAGVEAIRAVLRACSRPEGMDRDAWKSFEEVLASADRVAELIASFEWSTGSGDHVTLEREIKGGLLESMFSVLPERGSDDEDYPSSAQFRLIGTVVMGEDLVGMCGGDGFSRGYNPFDLYGAAEHARDKPLPPHMVFAELDKENPDDACAFLNAYGPLEGTSTVLTLKTDELNEWKNLARSSPSPEEHFRSIFREIPLMPDTPVPQEDFHSYPVALFWDAQSEFELAMKLRGALDSPTVQVEKIRRELAAKELQWHTTGRNYEREYIHRAQKFVITTVNKHLRLMSPRIARFPNRATVTSVWGCYTLLQAMYLMLFLDIAGWGGRIAQCEKCHSVFYTALDRGKYCSSECENRARALRAYYNKKGRS